LRPTLHDLGMGSGDNLLMRVSQPLQEDRDQSLDQALGQPDHHRRTVSILTGEPQAVFSVDVLGGDAVEGGHVDVAIGKVGSGGTAIS